MTFHDLGQATDAFFKDGEQWPGFFGQLDFDEYLEGSSGSSRIDQRNISADPAVTFQCPNSPLHRGGGQADPTAQLHQGEVAVLLQLTEEGHVHVVHAEIFSCLRQAAQRPCARVVAMSKTRNECAHDAVDNEFAAFHGLSP